VLNFRIITEGKDKRERDEGERTMFYSQCLLSSKGPLGAIWVAAYFFKKLKKAQVTETDISSSVGSSSFLFSFTICLCLYTYIHTYCLLFSILGLPFLFFFGWGGERVIAAYSFVFKS
jgi:hypothetical protein